MIALVLDHLWQSTLLALGLGLLVLMLRRAPAAVRHGLWFAASIKFLIPFAALALLGRLVGPAIPLPAQAKPEAALIERAAQPFSQSAFARSSLVQPSLPQPAVGPASAMADFPSAQEPAAPAPQAPAHAVAAVRAAPRLNLGPIIRLLPLVLLAIWALGSAAITIGWIRCWMRLTKVMRSATRVAWPAPMPVLTAPSLVEPGLLGLWQPVLLLPETLPDHLSPVETAAVIAHEACHLRRRDNLTAALHMLVEALFWFHPLVWWIGSRLIAERERACDEAVVGAGHDRAVYARSLVESCRLYLQSPLDCVAGASGSHLKTRVEAIMTAPPALPLSPLKKTLLLAAGACAVATPVAAGLLTTPEAQKAVARAAVLASRIAPAVVQVVRADPAAAPVSPAKPVVLAHNDPILAPRQSIAMLDAVAGPVSQDLPAIRVDQAQIAADEAPPARPIQPTSIGAQASSPANAKQQAFDFVQGYASATRQRQLIARWGHPICVQVTGLEPDQAAAVKARVEQIARAAKVGVQPADCQRPDVEIGFSRTPQAVLDDVIAHNPRILGDRTSGTRDVKTMSRPVQAWYDTNGVEFAENASEGLKASVVDRGGPAGWAGLKTLVDMQASPQAQADANYWNQSQGSLQGNPYPYDLDHWADLDNPRSSRQFLNALVIVDLTKADGVRLNALADGAAMLALAQPRSQGGCQALPSITDLFAVCPGRAAPAGLTPADTAYLAALYTSRSADITAIAQRMTGFLGAINVAGSGVGVAPTGGQPSPLPAPNAPVALAERLAGTRSAGSSAPPAPGAPPATASFHPAALHEPAPTTSPMIELASYSSPDLSRQARDFVVANARVGQFGYTVRWQEALCLQVFGLTPEQNAAVTSRIQAVGQTLAQQIYSPRGTSCPQKNVTILFSTNPQRRLDRMIAHDPWFLGDARSDTRAIKTINRPIQAWRVTVCTLTICRPEPFPQQPLAATVLVDARRIGATNLGAIADYMTMLVLADPRNLDHCQPLPSVLDLFVGPCPGRSAPTGMTRGDLAFLKALYTAGAPITQRDWNWSDHGGSVDQISGRMGMLLAGNGTLIIPGAKPVLR